MPAEGRVFPAVAETVRYKAGTSSGVLEVSVTGAVSGRDEPVHKGEGCVTIEERGFNGGDADGLTGGLDIAGRLALGEVRHCQDDGSGRLWFMDA